MSGWNRRSLVLGAGVVALGGCGRVYTPDYVLRTLRHQDASTDDFRWKRSNVIPASISPRPLPASAETSEVAQVFEQALQSDIDDFFARTGTQSLLVVRRGALNFQRYATGVEAMTPQATFSVSKSILSLLVGRALSAGHFQNLDDAITRYLPELLERDERFGRITLGHLIDMRSGIAFSDEISFPYITNDAPLVYYASDLREVVLTRTRIAAEPGAFLYNDYNPNLIALALERVVGVEGLRAMCDALWNGLGAQDEARWSTDNHGFPYWESGFVASPRDLAKIGQLVLTPNEALLSKNWRARISTAPTSAEMTEFNGRQWAYRAGWWLILRADGRHDLAAIGRFGQMIYVSPPNDVVIVRTGNDRSPPSDGDLTSLFFAVATQLGSRA